MCAVCLEVCGAEYAAGNEYRNEQAGESCEKVAADHHYNPGCVCDLLDALARPVSAHWLLSVRADLFTSNQRLPISVLSIVTIVSVLVKRSGLGC